MQNFHGALWTLSNTTFRSSQKSEPLGWVRQLPALATWPSVWKAANGLLTATCAGFFQYCILLPLRGSRLLTSSFPLGPSNSAPSPASLLSSWTSSLKTWANCLHPMILLTSQFLQMTGAIFPEARDAMVSVDLLTFFPCIEAAEISWAPVLLFPSLATAPSRSSFPVSPDSSCPHLLFFPFYSSDQISGVAW